MTRGDSERGAAVFRTYCSSCHGQDGKGGKAGSVVDGSYLALVSDEELRMNVILGRPASRRAGLAQRHTGQAASGAGNIRCRSVACRAAAANPGPALSDLGHGTVHRRSSMSAETGSSRRALLVKIGLLFNGVVGAALAVPIVRYLLSPVRKRRRLSVMAHARPTLAVSLGRNAPRHLSESRRQSWRWKDGRSSLLGSKRGRPEVPGVCDQLRAPGMSGALVSAVQSFHVSLPWRRLLPGWLARFRSTRAWIV